MTIQARRTWEVRRTYSKGTIEGMHGRYLLLLIILLLRPAPLQAQENIAAHRVEVGDSWTAVAIRHGVDSAALQAANPHMNQQRQPAVGQTIRIPTGEREPLSTGNLVRLNRGGLVTMAVSHNLSPWALAAQNGLASPYKPLLYRPLVLPGDAPLRELPPGFLSFELSQVPARPGEALAFRGSSGYTEIRGGGAAPLGEIHGEDREIEAKLNDRPFTVMQSGTAVVGLIGTGAFYPPGEHELAVQVGREPLWTQPWTMAGGDWIFQQITLTGSAAAIDQESINQERARLFAIWEVTTPVAHWDGSFQEPIRSYVGLSAPYGARRSYNGGPYRTYHEGVDYSAYGGTPVYAAASGTVVVAEFLYVRGGAVIVDHGWGVYTGYYHMSDVAAEVGQQVEAGQIVGAVGTTGLSTGNHLHWDLLVGGVWVDGLAWLEGDMGCWLLANDRATTCASGE
jgi:murein DD-endopeptidase MepM/ murein hydrolase activator NlpD